MAENCNIFLPAVACSLVQIHPTFRKNILRLSSGPKSRPKAINEKQAGFDDGRSNLFRKAHHVQRHVSENST
jgi:hypothetical protein